MNGLVYEKKIEKDLTWKFLASVILGPRSPARTHVFACWGRGLVTAAVKGDTSLGWDAGVAGRQGE